jgi:hypothetical protein
MNINELLKIADHFISEPIVKFTINKELFNNTDGRKLYNKRIRDKVLDKYGVYIWTDSKTDEIFYIGMAGKIKTDGSLSNHSIQKRLLASRGKDKNTKKDIQTNDYIKKFMIDNDIKSMNFYVLYLEKEVPPSYVEALLLNSFYNKKKCLPKLNKSF